MTTTKRFAVLPSFLTPEEQRRLVADAISSHSQHSPSHQDGCENDAPEEDPSHSRLNQSSSSLCPCHWQELDSATSSKRFLLGIDCGGSLPVTLHLSVTLARRAFQEASHFEHLSNVKTLKQLAQNESPLTGLVLLYGPNSHMKAHYDAPTQPGQREEWLVMFTVGNTVRFRCNGNIISLQSGDALVMDSMAVLHGVEEIDQENDLSILYGLPVRGSRLGVLLWQGRRVDADSDHGDKTEVCVDGMASLFDEED